MSMGCMAVSGYKTYAVMGVCGCGLWSRCSPIQASMYDQGVREAA